MTTTNNGEQLPIEDNVQITDVNENQGNFLSENQNSSSNLGKFKDTDSLLSAYNSLQAEFTKKCQRLSQLEKEKDTETKENITKNQNSQPIFEDENWTDKVSAFLNLNKDAKKFSKEISEIILSDNELKNNNNALELAWAKVVQKNYVSPDKITKDEQFINNYILQSEEIKNKVLLNILKEQKNKQLPPVITAHTGGAVAFNNAKKATSLSEARKLVEDIFNN